MTQKHRAAIDAMNAAGERIEFTHDGRRFAVTYNAGSQDLEEYITPKSRRSYWRSVPNYGRSRDLRREVLGNRTKKDFAARSNSMGGSDE